MRVLKLLRVAGENGVTVKRLIDVMDGFGYDISMICDVVNELKNEQKRHIWSDSVRLHFRGGEDLVNHGHTKLFISTAGEGYSDYLDSNIEYIQEVMLDTKVDGSGFGNEWHYDEIEDRFELLQKFLTMLFKFDQEETQNFATKKDAHEYELSFGSNDMISKLILEGVRDSVDRILSAIVKNMKLGEAKDSFREFRASHLAIYEDRLNTLENLEYELFG